MDILSANSEWCFLFHNFLPILHLVCVVYYNLNSSHTESTNDGFILMNINKRKKVIYELSSRVSYNKELKSVKFLFVCLLRGYSYKPTTIYSVNIWTALSSKKDTF